MAFLQLENIVIDIFIDILNRKLKPQKYFLDFLTTNSRIIFLYNLIIVEDDYSNNIINRKCDYS